MAKKKRLHYPPREDLDEPLTVEARRRGESTTAVARVAVEDALRNRRRRAQEDEVAAYAALHAGSELDLDPDLERAGLEALSEEW